MKRVLMVTPHFPPDTGAATHRVRLLAPHLSDFGWAPTILTVDPRDYEGRLDNELEALVPDSLDVRRVRAWPARWTRLLSVGDLGLRAFWGLYRACRVLLQKEDFQLFYVTIFPTYPALLGPLVKRRSEIPFVLDYIDPWVGAWGATTGPGENGSPDFKSRLSRKVGEVLEPVALRAADGITAVSEATYKAIHERIPQSKRIPSVTIPYGGEAADFEYLRRHPRKNVVFDDTDGRFRISYVGTLLPLGRETLRAFLHAVALLRERDPRLYARLRVYFVGTSNQTTRAVQETVTPEARRIGVEEAVVEVPGRLNYLDALNVLVRSDAVLLMGSSEPHYTASKLYPALLAKRPVLAAYHAESSVVRIVERAARAPTFRLITYDDRHPVESCIDALYSALRAVMDSPSFDPSHVDSTVLEEYSARSMSARLAKLFDELTSPP